jgi:hypothetical protein
MNSSSQRRDALASTLGVASLSLSILILLAVCLIALVTAFELLAGRSTTTQSSWTLIVVLLSMAALSLPGAYFGLTRPPRTPLNQSGISPVGIATLLVSFGIVLLLGTWVLRNASFFVWLSPVMHILAAGLPVLTSAMLILKRAEPFSQIRAWGSFLSGLWLAPLFALILEISLAIPLLIVLFIGSADTINTPQLLESLSQSPGSPEILVYEQLNSVLKQPLVIAVTVGYLSLAVPIIEEVGKSLGTWMLVRRKLTPSLAFVGGTLSGAAYGLFEAFFLAQPGGEWASLMIARAGASLMHMFTAGLTGLGIYYGVRERRWGKFVLMYAAAIALHGVWNFAALGLGLEELARIVAEPVIGAGSRNIITLVSTGALLSMTAGAAFGLWTIPARLRGSQAELEGGTLDPP